MVVFQFFPVGAVPDNTAFTVIGLPRLQLACHVGLENCEFSHFPPSFDYYRACPWELSANSGREVSRTRVRKRAVRGLWGEGRSFGIGPEQWLGVKKRR